MWTWIGIGVVFLAGVGLYAYLMAQENQQQEDLKQVFDEKMDTLLGSLHSMTDGLKARMPHSQPQPKSEFDSQLQEAMKDNP